MRGAFWWIDRWRKSTAYTDMTLAEQGAYRNILDELWLRDGVIPDDERTLARASGDPLEWPAIRAKVLAHFHLTPEGWRNETHDEVAGASRLQAEKGRKRAAVAERSGGRFTSRTPADQPAVEPAEHQPHPPADDQPPYTVHRTPYTVVPSLRSGEVSTPPVVSVKAPFQAADNPLVGFVEGSERGVTVLKSDRIVHGEPGEPRRAVGDPPVVAWSREACDDWISRFGGTAPGGQIGKAMKPLVDRHGWAAVRAAWQSYLGQTEAEYASPTRFASTFGRWSGGEAPGAGKSTAAQRTIANLEAWVASKEGKS